MRRASIYQRAADLCRAIAPHDLRDRAVYIVPRHRLRGQYGCRGCMAFTHPALDLALRPELERRGEWRGRGFGAIVFRERVAERFGPAWQVERGILGSAVHELGHYLDEWHPLAHVAPERIPEAWRPLTVAGWQRAGTVDPPSSTGEKPAPRYPWHGHTAQWIRATLHLQYRAEQLGERLPWPELQVAGDFYGVSHPDVYQAILGHEPADFLDAPMRAILGVRPSQPFVDRWLADIAPWEREYGIGAEMRSLLLSLGMPEYLDSYEARDWATWNLTSTAAT